MANREALERTLVALRELGRLAPVDEALVELCRDCADGLDGARRPFAQLVKEYRECLVLLTQVGRDDDGDAFADLLADLHSSVGDSPKG